MHYSGENMHKTILFCIKVKNMLNSGSLVYVFVSKCISFQSKCKEHEEGIVYLCHVGKWIL